MGQPPDQSLPRALVRPLQSKLSVDQALVNFRQESDVALLESSLHNNTYARFSILAANPAHTVRIDETTTDHVVDALRSRFASFPKLALEDNRLPFVGGWIGWIGYEAGAAIENVGARAPRDLPLPDAEFRLYDAAAVYDHHLGQWYATAINWPAQLMPLRQTATDRLDAITSLLSAAPPSEPTKNDAAAPLIEPQTTPDRPYRSAFEQSMQYIEAGDIYQVNLTHRFEAPATLPPQTLYQQLRDACPAPFSAFLAHDNYAVISASPELFVNLQGEKVTTRPIKGTSPRTGNAAADARNRNALQSSDKDKAELNMIVDLLRNDLGRVCQFGTVLVKSGGTIETHPNVFHRVATIEGRTDKTWADVLTAALPGGSITGAPKIRAMQIITELEPTRRDVYCGAIGYIGLDGNMTMNIAIRTMVHTQGSVYWHAGGAIVADSNVNSEWQELIAKASAMRLVAKKQQSRYPRREVVVT